MLHEELHQILDYWLDNTIDDDYGGFVGRINNKNQIDETAPKSAVLNARILWTFSAAYRVEEKSNYKKNAVRAFHYLNAKFIDKDCGGLYWMLDYEGNVLVDKKYTYAQSFAIYAYSEYFRATGNKESLEEAINLFRLLQKYSYDPNSKGYHEAFDRYWKPVEDVRLGSTDKLEKYSMNTHLHIMEAYTNLYRVWPDDELAVRIRELLDLFCTVFYDDTYHHFIAFMDVNWQPKSHVYSYGHDIEAVWLMLDAANVIKDTELFEQTKKVAEKVAYKVKQEGIDDVYGGLFNGGADGKVIDETKDFWPQAEAMVGFYYAWCITGEQEFLDIIPSIWKFIHGHIKNHESGEWFLKVSRLGEPFLNEDKVGPWKCPYHTSRAFLEIKEKTREIYRGSL